MISNRLLPLLGGSLVACTGMVSCNRSSSSDVAVAEMKLADKDVEIEDLKGEVQKLKAKAEETKKDDAKAESTLQELKDAKRENETLKDEAEDLRKEIEKLKDQVTAKVRYRAVGEKHERISAPNGKTYTQVTIRKVDDEGVSIAHDGGFSTLNVDTAPATWVERFRLGSRKPEPPPPSEAMEKEAVAATPGPTPSKKGGKDDQNAAVRAKLPGVLLIQGEKTKGSGFLVARDGSLWLYTAAHVLTGGKDLTMRNTDGAKLSGLGKCEIAEDCDLARIEVSVKPELALSVVKPRGIEIGQDIVAVGNSGGADVLPLLNGKINALGPKEIEVTAGVIQGNSGGPVMLAETGEVVGVVCRAEAGRTDVWAANTDFSQIRRFATRIDRQIPWRATSLESLQTENQRIATFDSRTRLVFAMAALEPGQNGLRLDMQIGGGKGQTIMAIFMQHKNLAPVQRLIQMNKQLSEKALRSSERDLRKRFAGFYRDLLNVVANDTADFRPVDFSFVNRKEAELSIKWRKEATNLLAAAANALGR